MQAGGHWSDSQGVAYRTGRSILALTIALGLLLAVVAISRPDRPVKARARTLTDAELVDVGRQATVVLTSGPCQGSAFFVTPELLLTNAHVVCAETAEARVGDRAVPATIVQVDDELDVALLRAEGAGGTPLRLADVMTVRPGDRVAAAGAPGGRDVSVVPGVITLPLTRIWGVLHIEAHASLSQGNSGGPLLDARGAAIGVISKRRAAGGRPVALALPLDYIAEWLPSGIAVEGPGWNDRVTEAARSADADLEHFRARAPRTAAPGRALHAVRPPAALARRRRAGAGVRRRGPGVRRSASAHAADGPADLRRHGARESRRCRRGCRSAARSSARRCSTSRSCGRSSAGPASARWPTAWRCPRASRPSRPRWSAPPASSRSSTATPSPARVAIE